MKSQSKIPTECRGVTPMQIDGVLNHTLLYQILHFQNGCTKCINTDKWTQNKQNISLEKWTRTINSQIIGDTLEVA